MQPPPPPYYPPQPPPPPYFHPPPPPPPSSQEHQQQQQQQQQRDQKVQEKQERQPKKEGNNQTRRHSQKRRSGPAPSITPPPLECTPEGDVVIRAADGHRYRRSVCVFIMNPHGRFLAGRRRDDRRVLQCVQGGATPHESPIQTAEREVFEELGIPSTQLRLVAEIPPPTPAETRNAISHDPRAVFRYNSKSWRKYGIKGQELYPLLVRANTEVIHTLNFSAVPGVRPEFCAAQWVTLEELMQYCSPSKREVVANMCAAVAPLVLRVLSEEGVMPHVDSQHQEEVHRRSDGSNTSNNGGMAKGRW
ncbi:NUDIX hydrolase [Trypanosoma theileri]|uniref:NUDIX hydrolase n=1 Tax=Trypanosoma theileri TaxID=67003 RepID=A0A1X0P292_9TRYP|nr:NUDIX hydrolase [Trypanosoma theileri]ORC90948.1 NUDIX hydrolase [Trypanosoma theileri]